MSEIVPRDELPFILQSLPPYSRIFWAYLGPTTMFLTVHISQNTQRKICVHKIRRLQSVRRSNFPHLSRPQWFTGSKTSRHDFPREKQGQVRKRVRVANFTDRATSVIYQKLRLNKLFSLSQLISSTINNARNKTFLKHKFGSTQLYPKSFIEHKPTYIGRPHK